MSRRARLRGNTQTRAYEIFRYQRRAVLWVTEAGSRRRESLLRIGGHLRAKLQQDFPPPDPPYPPASVPSVPCVVVGGPTLVFPAASVPKPPET